MRSAAGRQEKWERERERERQQQGSTGRWDLTAHALTSRWNLPGAVEAHSSHGYDIWCCGAEYSLETEIFPPNQRKLCSSSSSNAVSQCLSLVKCSDDCCSSPALPCAEPCVGFRGQWQLQMTAGVSHSPQLVSGPGSVNISPHCEALRHGEMSLSEDSEASNSSISDTRFGSQTVAPDSPTPYTDAIKVNISRKHFISTGPNSSFEQILNDILRRLTASRQNARMQKNEWDKYLTSQ